ncbi:MAG: phosphoribosyltransferase family protein [Acidithiobacillus sp.]
MTHTDHHSSNTYLLNINGVQRHLPLFKVQPDLAIAVLNILGDTELTEAAAHALNGRMAEFSYDVIVTAEAKSIPLAYALSVHSGRPYIVLRKNYKSYMGEALSSETLSITTGKPQTLYLDAKDRKAISGRRVVLVDDVVSTGSTLAAMRALMTQAEAEIAAVAAICTEGDATQWSEVIALAHLPVFPLSA